MMRNDEDDSINIKKLDKHNFLKNASKGMEDITTSDELHRLITLLERDYKKKKTANCIPNNIIMQTCRSTYANSIY